MASISELFNTGYVFESIDEDSRTGISLRLRRDFVFPQFYYRPSHLIANDLEEFLRDRLYLGTFIEGTFRTFGNWGWHIAGIRLSESDEMKVRTCATVAEIQAGIILEAKFHPEALDLFPDVGVTAQVQQLRMVEDYAQLFKFTKQGILMERNSARRPMRPTYEDMK